MISPFYNLGKAGVIVDEKIQLFMIIISFKKFNHAIPANVSINHLKML